MEPQFFPQPIQMNRAFCSAHIVFSHTSVVYATKNSVILHVWDRASESFGKGSDEVVEDEDIGDDGSEKAGEYTCPWYS